MSRLLLGVLLAAATTSPKSCSTLGQDDGGAGDAAPGMTAPAGPDAGSDASAAPPREDAAPPPPENDATAGEDAAAPASGDATPLGESGSPDAGDAEICRSEWPQSDWLFVSGMWQATDSSGNTYVALNYGSNAPLTGDAGTPRLNLGTPPTQVAQGFAIAKFDDACNLLWVREFGPSGAAYSYGAQANAIAADSASNVTVLGDFFGSVDLGAGALTAGAQSDNGFLLRLDATGATVFSRQFVDSTSDAQITEYGLAVTPSGVSTITVSADTATDFGSGEDAVSQLLGVKSANYLVQFDGGGNVVFRETAGAVSGSIGGIFGVVTNATGFLWATGTAYSNPPLTPFDVSSTQYLALGIKSSGAYAWQEDAADGVLAAGPSGAVEATFGATSETLQAFASDGTSPWSTSTTVTGAPGPSRLGVDSAGDPLLAGAFQGSVAFGALPTLTSAGGQDVDYQVLDATGHPSASGSWGGPDDDTPAGIGADPAGNLLLAGRSSPITVDATSRVFFVKLAR